MDASGAILVWAWSVRCCFPGFSVLGLQTTGPCSRGWGVRPAGSAGCLTTVEVCSKLGAGWGAGGQNDGDGLLEVGDSACAFT